MQIDVFVWNMGNRWLPSDPIKANGFLEFCFCIASFVRRMNGLVNGVSVVCPWNPNTINSLINNLLLKCTCQHNWKRLCLMAFSFGTFSAKLVYYCHNVLVTFDRAVYKYTRGVLSLFIILSIKSTVLIRHFRWHLVSTT